MRTAIRKYRIEPVTTINSNPNAKYIHASSHLQLICNCYCTYMCAVAIVFRLINSVSAQNFMFVTRLQFGKRVKFDVILLPNIRKN